MSEIVFALEKKPSSYSFLRTVPGPNDDVFLVAFDSPVGSDEPLLATAADAFLLTRAFRFGFSVAAAGGSIS